MRLLPKWTSKLNIRQQKRILKIILTYFQVLANIITFEAKGLIFLDLAILSTNKRTPRELILNLKRLSEEK